ncbi:transcription factor TFIID (or TATA-binding protein TBP) [Acanthocystis turfacea Chlorella virus Can0610SP]|nr:transcription factor TFIID (or TATA-binding protein TBP) [Acanthocystis turfacea Chlorella virus Can0610SP]
MLTYTYHTDSLFKLNMEHLSAEFMSMFNSMASLKTTHVFPTPVQLSTMTLSGKYNNDDTPLPVDVIRKAMTGIVTEDGLQLAVPKVVKHRDPAARNTNMRKFDHQVSFNLGTSSMKVFYNGALHGTGFSSIDDFMIMAALVAKQILTIAGIELEVADVSTNLINMSTSTVDALWRPVKFNMKHLAAAFERTGVQSYFNPEQHPAVKVLLSDSKKKLCTAFVFPTGSISIFGSKEPKHIAQIYRTLFEVMDANFELAQVCDLRKTTLKTRLDISHGYPSSSVRLLK